jgi:hypothetical protein
MILEKMDMLPKYLDLKLVISEIIFIALFVGLARP